MVERHHVDEPRYDPGDIPAENVERQGDDRLSVFEWYCPDCDDWLGWPENPAHAALVCADPAACDHTDEDEPAACGHVVCGACATLADSHEWVLEGKQAGAVAERIFDDSTDIELEFRQALLEDLQQVTDGESVEEILADRQELFEEYAHTVADDDTEE
ncbi:hypothetical protein [Salinibaculum rarum]|uniref:hypothetical protein n=1 Tax=Salinibaculum rarum TaxID=3058903 RepID=UPI00265DAEB9|nr:hypothetical protein [Salinibaculum sp. KK48]